MTLRSQIPTAFAIVILTSCGSALAQESSRQDLLATGVRPVSAWNDQLRSESINTTPNDDWELSAPRAPAGLQVLVSALMTLGAWQLTKSAKNIHFSAPDWYHTGGPSQVGNATPYDFDQYEIPLCWLDEPQLEPELNSYTIEVCEFTALRSPISLFAGPRAPPIHA